MTLIGRTFIVTIMIFLFLVADTQAQEYCPQNTACVQSTTLLSYDAGTAMMDAFTYATTDYGTAYWYNLCANLAILKLDGTPPYGWSVPLPSGPPICYANTTGVYVSGYAAAEPGIDFVAVGSALVEAVFQYSEVVYDCYIYCTGYWDDEYAYGYASVSQPPVYGPSHPSSATIAPYPFQSRVPRQQRQVDQQGSLDRKGVPLPNLLLTYNGNQIQPDSTVWIWNDANLNGAPRMPPVIATLNPNNFSQQVRWWMRVAYSSPDNSQWLLNAPNKYTTASGSYNLMTDSGAIAGGEATLFWKIGNGPEQQARLYIDGTNPDRNLVKNALGNNPWFIQLLATSETNVACVDGGLRQFNTSCTVAGKPVWGHPHGFGLMQIDPPPDLSALWDWTVNVGLGKQKINNTSSSSNTFWNNQVQEYQQYKATHPNAKPPCDITEGNAQQCRFGFVESGNTHSFRDAIWIKQYNGATANYISWNTNPNNPTNQYWQANRYNSENPPFNYVNRVCSQTVPNAP